ncbi:hypothetical protein Sjap_024044 [Stephania japonica]|uniref:Uncharacterized protein n=1 Tax=Stephania japonica TaxID=461633 RepID=A0AAP0HNC1_9MAGN
MAYSYSPTLPIHSTRRPPPYCTPFATIKSMAKELYFNHDLAATRKLQVGVDTVAELVGVTLGPKGRNVVLQNKYGPPKIVNDGETVLKQVELEDPLENVGVKLVRLAGAKTNDLAGDGSTTSIVLAQGLIAEGMKVIAAGINPIQISRGIEKTAKALVSELKLMSRVVKDHELVDVAAVSAGNDYVVGNMIAKAFQNVGRNGIIRIEKGKSTENSMQIVEGMQFDRGYLSPYFVNDRQKMVVEFHNCKLLLVDKKISNPKDLFKILDSAVKEKFPIVIIAEDIEQGALAPIIRNKLKGVLKAVAIKAPSFGERKSHYLDDIAILTGATIVRDEMGITLEKSGKDVLGTATKVVVTKDTSLIVTDGSTQSAVNKRVGQIQRLVESHMAHAGVILGEKSVHRGSSSQMAFVAEPSSADLADSAHENGRSGFPNSNEKFQKKLLNERIARLSGGIAILQVGAQTEVELKDKQLRLEDAVNATKAAIEEGVVVGGGCCLLRLSLKVGKIRESLENEEQKRLALTKSLSQIGADIFKRALAYPAKLIAKNAGVNGSIVIEKVACEIVKILSSNDLNYGYNAAKDCYEDLLAAGIMDPSKVVRCCIENASSVAKTFITSDLVVIDLIESNPTRLRKPMPSSGNIIYPNYKWIWFSTYVLAQSVCSASHVNLGNQALPGIASASKLESRLFGFLTGIKSKRRNTIRDEDRDAFNLISMGNEVCEKGEQERLEFRTM